MITNDDREWLVELLPKSAQKHVDAILEYFGDDEPIDGVDIIGARVPVESTKAYGLTIELDAHGNAAKVGFPYGAEVAA